MGPVIACIDDSGSSRQGIRVASRLATGLGLPLVLLHVAPPTEAPGVSAAAAGQQRLQDEERRDAEALLERMATDEGLGADVERRAAVGQAAATILDVCERAGAELVVLGSRGRGGLKSAVLGSVSSEVAARAPCPCVIVPPTALGQQTSP
jgi:nucleotide-binding universal stress UspA family protein